MQVFNAVFEHANFGGRTFFRGTGGARYRWDNWWGDNNDLFSSMRMWGIGGARATSYAFDDFGLRGRFAALNVGGAFSSAWWWYFGPDFNDVVSSTLIVERAPADREVLIPLKSSIVSQVATMLPKDAMGLPLEPDGGARIFGTFFPHWNPQGVFLTIEQSFDLDVDISAGPLGIGPSFDYDIAARWHVRFWTEGGQVHGRAVRTEVTVTGVYSDRVANAVLPGLIAQQPRITAAVESKLAPLRRQWVADVYLLPGPVPDMDLAGFKGRDDDDVCLALVR